MRNAVVVAKNKDSNRMTKEYTLMFKYCKAKLINLTGAEFLRTKGIFGYGCNSLILTNNNKIIKECIACGVNYRVTS